MGNGKIWPQLPLNPITKICIGDYVEDTYHPAKFDPDRIRGFCFRICVTSYTKFFTRLFFGFFTSPQQRRPHRLWRKIRKKTWFCARMCLFGVKKKQNLAFAPLFFLKKTANFRPDFVLGNFHLKNSINIGCAKSKKPLNVIVAHRGQGCMYVSFGQGSSLLWIHMLRPLYSRSIVLTREGRSQVDDVCECMRDWRVRRGE